MNFKSKLMFKQKDLNGGEYYKVDGKWFWRKTSTDKGVLVTMRWLHSQIKTSVASVVVEAPVVTPVKKVKKEKPVV